MTNIQETMINIVGERENKLAYFYFVVFLWFKCAIARNVVAWWQQATNRNAALQSNYQALVFSRKHLSLKGDAKHYNDTGFQCLNAVNNKLVMAVATERSKPLWFEKIWWPSGKKLLHEHQTSDSMLRGSPLHIQYFVYPHCSEITRPESRSVDSLPLCLRGFRSGAKLMDKSFLSFSIGRCCSAVSNLEQRVSCRQLMRKIRCAISVYMLYQMFHVGNTIVVHHLENKTYFLCMNNLIQG